MQTTTIEKISKSTANNLNDLIQINLDSEKGFCETADDLNSDMYNSLFHEIAEERRQQADQLKGVVEAEDYDSNDSGSLLGQAYRWWADLRDKLSDSPNYAVLAEAERGEDKILHMYQDLDEELRDTPVYELIHQHRVQVKRRHDQVRDLRDKAKKIEGRD